MTRYSRSDEDGPQRPDREEGHRELDDLVAPTDREHVVDEDLADRRGHDAEHHREQAGDDGVDEAPPRVAESGPDARRAYRNAWPPLANESIVVKVMATPE